MGRFGKVCRSHGARGIQPLRVNQPQHTCTARRVRNVSEVHTTSSNTGKHEKTQETMEQESICYIQELFDDWNHIPK